MQDPTNTNANTDTDTNADTNANANTDTNANRDTNANADTMGLSNDELIAALGTALQKAGALVASVIAMLMEVEERRLHLELACSSMFDFCTRRLGMSEGEAYRRITVARLARQFPEILDAVRSRRVHLSSLVLLRDVLTRENVAELLHAAAGKTKCAVQQLVARLAPKPDVPAVIRKLPPHPAPATVRLTSAAVAQSAMHGTSTPPMAAPSEPRGGAPNAKVTTVAPQLTPLAESRYKVQLTASSALREKLERAQSLMRHRNVDGDLAVVVERAMDLLIAKLEREKLATTKRAPSPAPPKNRTAIATDAKRKAIPAETRREIMRRDGEQCAFVGSNGERCPARDFLEIDHRHPRALGGSNDARNLRLLCRSHNQHAAERIFGRELVSRAIDMRRRKRQRPRPTDVEAAGQTSLLRS